jgi:hypothetical protein
MKEKRSNVNIATMRENPNDCWTYINNLIRFTAHLAKEFTEAKLDLKFIARDFISEMNSPVTSVDQSSHQKTKFVYTCFKNANY